jgi:hypothetical protein
MYLILKAILVQYIRLQLFGYIAPASQHALYIYAFLRTTYLSRSRMLRTLSSFASAPVWWEGGAAVSMIYLTTKVIEQSNPRRCVMVSSLYSVIFACELGLANRIPLYELFTMAKHNSSLPFYEIFEADLATLAHDGFFKWET